MSSEPTTEALPDGAIRVCLNGRCGTVSSWHLVPGKIAQLSAVVGPGEPKPNHHTRTRGHGVGGRDTTPKPLHTS